MRTAQDTWTIARQIAFFPTAGAGKIHAAWKVTHTAVCGVPAELEAASWITVSQGQASEKVHPMVCRRCLRLSTLPGVSGLGMEA